MHSQAQKEAIAIAEELLDKDPYPTYDSSTPPLNISGDAIEELRKKYHGFTTETDVKIAELKTSLQCWRELLLPVHSILHWEKQWHPFGIVGSISSFFMLLWLLEPSVLSTVSLMCLTIIASEFFVPRLATTLMKNEPWTQKHEEKYDLICRGIVISREKLIINYRTFCLLRSTRPRVYYPILITLLVILAWLGNTVDNLFLTYMLVTFLCLKPGLEKHGVLQRYGCILSDKIADMATNGKIDVAKSKPE